MARLAISLLAISLVVAPIVSAKAEAPGATAPASPSAVPGAHDRAVLVDASRTIDPPATIDDEPVPAPRSADRAVSKARSTRTTAEADRFFALEREALRPSRVVEPPAASQLAIHVRELDRMFGDDAPEVAYAIAHALDARGRAREATGLYREVLDRWRSSRVAPQATFALGVRAAREGDRVDAARRFLDVARSTEKDELLRGLAWHRLAVLAEGRGEVKAAALARAEVAAWAARRSGTPDR